MFLQPWSCKVSSGAILGRSSDYPGLMGMSWTYARFGVLHGRREAQEYAEKQHVRGKTIVQIWHEEGWIP